MSANKFADIISRIIGPLLWLPLLLILLIFKTGLTQDQIFILLPALILFIVGIPFFYLFIALKYKWVDKWDLPNREERRPMLVILFFCSIIGLVFIYKFGNRLLLDLFALLLTTGFITSLITYYWKISIHMVLDTTVIFLINYLFGWHLWPLFLLIPLVGWARLKLRRHTLLQLTAGTILPLIIFAVGFKISHLL